MDPRHTSQVVVKVRGLKFPEPTGAFGPVSRVAESGRRRRVEGAGECEGEGKGDEGETERGLPGGVRWFWYW